MANIRRGLAVVAALLALIGAGMIAYPFATDLWAARIQSGLMSKLNAAGAYDLTALDDGDPLTRLEIPRLG